MTAASIASSKYAEDTFRSQHKDSRKDDVAVAVGWTSALIVTSGGREGTQAPVAVVVVVVAADGVLGNTDRKVAG